MNLTLSSKNVRKDKSMSFKNAIITDALIESKFAAPKRWSVTCSGIYAPLSLLF